MNHELLSLLITQTWQVTLLAITVWIVVRLTARNRPHLAHALWVLVLIKCVTPPVFSSPASPFSWMFASPATVENSGDQIRELKNLASSDEPEFASPYDTIMVRAVPDNPNVAENDSSVFPWKRSASSIPATVSPDTPSKTTWAQTILVLWMAGAWIGILFVGIRLGLFCRWMKRQRQIDDPDLVSLVQNLVIRLGIKRCVRVRIIDGPVGPAVLGWLRPTILLPSAVVRARPADELEPLVAHELIHVRRGDLWWALVQTVARSLFWFHPLIQLAARMVTRESERSCDEETIASLGCSPASYAKGLLDVLEHKNRLRVAPALPGVRPVDITSARLERVMNLGNGIHRRTPFWVWLVLVACSVTVLPGAAMVFAQEQLPRTNKATDNPVETATPLPPDCDPVPYLGDLPILAVNQENEPVPFLGDIPIIGTLFQNNPDDSPTPAEKANSSIEPWTITCYQVGDLIVKWRESDQYDGSCFTMFMGCHAPGCNGRDVVPGDQTATVKAGRRVLSFGNRQPTMQIVDNQMYVFGPERVQKEIATSLERLRNHSFRQIVVRTQLVETSVEDLEQLGIDWSMAPVAAKGIIRNETDQSDPLNQKVINQYAAQLIGTDYWSADVSDISSRDLAQLSNQPQNIAATSFIEKNSPVLHALLTPEEFQQVIGRIKSSRDSNLLSAPNVMMMDGQNAAVFSGAQRPFVVSVNQITDQTRENKAIQPVIRVVSEGIVLKMNSKIVADNLINLNLRMEHSTILNVDTVALPIRSSDGERVSIQVPEVATTRIQSSQDVPRGRTLVLSGVQKNEAGKNRLFLAFITCDLPGSETGVLEEAPQEPQLLSTLPTMVARIGPDGGLVLEPKFEGMRLPEATPAAPETSASESEPVPVNLVVRSEIPAKGLKSVSITDPESPLFGATIEGAVDIELQNEMPELRGEKLTICMDGARFAGDRGELRVQSEDCYTIRMQGSVQVGVAERGIELQTDELVFEEQDSRIRIELRGSCQIRVNEDDDAWECVADNITIDPDSPVVTLTGNARFIRHSGTHADIQADLIRVNLVTQEIETSGIGEIRSR